MWHDVKPDLLAQLLAMLPECSYRSFPGDKESFRLELPEGDSRIGPVLDLLHAHGDVQAEDPARIRRIDLCGDGGTTMRIFQQRNFSGQSEVKFGDMEMGHGAKMGDRD